MKVRQKRPKFESEARRELRHIRSNLGHTQHSFAPLLGLIPSTYEKYERGLHKLPAGLLEKARQLETTPRSEAPPQSGAGVGLPDVGTTDEPITALTSPLEAATASAARPPMANGDAPAAQDLDARGGVIHETSPLASSPTVGAKRSCGEARYARWIQAYWCAQLSVSLFILARMTARDLGWHDAWRLGPNDEGLAIAIILFFIFWLLLGQETLRRITCGLPLRDQRGS